MKKDIPPRTVKGTFFLPEYPETKHNGTLSILENNTGWIELFGSFPSHHIGYFGETDHPIPWQIDHLNCWRTDAANAVEACTKIVI